MVPTQHVVAPRRSAKAPGHAPCRRRCLAVSCSAGQTPSTQHRTDTALLLLVQGITGSPLAQAGLQCSHYPWPSLPPLCSWWKASSKRPLPLAELLLVRLGLSQPPGLGFAQSRMLGSLSGLWDHLSETLSCAASALASRRVKAALAVRDTSSCIRNDG